MPTYAGCSLNAQDVTIRQERSARYQKGDIALGATANISKCYLTGGTRNSGMECSDRSYILVIRKAVSVRHVAGILAN